jgi:hypothetical protein
LLESVMRTVPLFEGEGRMTVFASSGQARTLDYRAGDVGYVPFAMGHYVKNTGPTPIRFLEICILTRRNEGGLGFWHGWRWPLCAAGSLGPLSQHAAGRNVGRR